MISRRVYMLCSAIGRRRIYLAEDLDRFSSPAWIEDRIFAVDNYPLVSMLTAHPIPQER